MPSSGRWVSLFAGEFRRRPGFRLLRRARRPGAPSRGAQGISPPAGGDLLFPWRKRRQNAPGDAPNGLRLRFAPPRPIGRHPTLSGPAGHLPLTGGAVPGPLYEGYPLNQAKNLRRAKSEWLISIPAGPLGPVFPKIATAAISHLRLALPSQRYLVC